MCANLCSTNAFTEIPFHKNENDKYRRVIWQCSHKFKDKTRCRTPHLTEDEIKAAFVRMVNKLYADREFYITELTAVKNRLGDTTALEKERRILDEQFGIDAKAVNDLPELITEFDESLWAGLWTA